MWMNDHCGAAVVVHVAVECIDHRTGKAPLHHTDVVLRAAGTLRHWRQAPAGERWQGVPREDVAGRYAIGEAVDASRLSGAVIIDLSGAPDDAVVSYPDVDELVWNLGNDVWILIEPDENVIDEGAEFEQ